MGRILKTCYFDEKNISSKAKSILNWVNTIVRVKDFEFIPEKSAMVVLDMQRYFLEEGSHAHIPSAMAIIPNLLEIIRLYKEKGLPVIFTRHINDEENAGKLGMWWHKLIKRDDPLSAIIDDFDLSYGSVIEKSQYDAFIGTGLDRILKWHGVEKLLITGVMTHLCCETTARSAFIRGYDVFFMVDGTATYNEEFHRASILNLAHGFAIPVLSEEIKGILNGLT